MLLFATIYVAFIEDLLIPCPKLKLHFIYNNKSILEQMSFRMKLRRWGPRQRPQAATVGR